MMKKILFILILLAFAVSGCISHHNSTPADLTVRQVVHHNAKVKILGTTEATTNFIVLFGFWAISSDSEKVGAFPGIFGFRSAKIRAEQAVTYKALENYPDAQRVLDPIFKTTVKNYFIIKIVDSTVKGTAAKFTY